ncbi:hypothetical protein PMAYCL1PPCAC_22534, partial [Pristionchus mayeri]
RTNIIDQLTGRDRIPAFMRMRQAAIDVGDAAAPAAVATPTMKRMERLLRARGQTLSTDDPDSHGELMQSRRCWRAARVCCPHARVRSCRSMCGR